MFKKIIIGGLCFVMVFMLVGCEKKITIEQTLEGDYLLNIFVSQTTFSEGADIEVTMVFENNSGQEQIAYHSSPMINLLTVKDGNYTQVDVGMQTTLIQGETITKRFYGSKLEKGRHELIAIADYSLGSNYGGEEMRIYSNTISVTVT